MRTTVWSAFVLSVAGLIGRGVASANQLPPGTPSPNAMMRRMQQVTVDTMPLVSPRDVPAIVAAKRTLTAAQAKVAKAALRTPTTTMGFVKPTLSIGTPSFANEIAIYAISSEGHRRHIGYAMEMRVDSHSNETVSNGGLLAPVVPIAISLAGRILMPLYRGEKAVFAMGHKGVTRATLNGVGDRDLKSKHPLDYQAQVLRRAQRAMVR